MLARRRSVSPGVRDNTEGLIGLGILLSEGVPPSVGNLLEARSGSIEVALKVSGSPQVEEGVVYDADVAEPVTDLQSFFRQLARREFESVERSGVCRCRPEPAVSPTIANTADPVYPTGAGVSGSFMTRRGRACVVCGT